MPCTPPTGVADAAPFGGVSEALPGGFRPGGRPSAPPHCFPHCLISALLSRAAYTLITHNLSGAPGTSVVPGLHGCLFRPWLCAQIARAAGRPKAGRCRPTFPGRPSTRDARAAPWTTCNMACNQCGMQEDCINSFISILQADLSCSHMASRHGMSPAVMPYPCIHALHAHTAKATCEAVPRHPCMLL